MAETLAVNRAPREVDSAAALVRASRLMDQKDEQSESRPY